MIELSNKSAWEVDNVKVKMGCYNKVSAQEDELKNIKQSKPSN